MLQSVKETGNPPTCSKQERTVLSGSDIWCEFEPSQYFSFLEKSKTVSKTYHSDQGEQTPAHQMRIAKISMKN